MTLFPDFLRAVVTSTMNALLMLALIQAKYSKTVTRLAMFSVISVDVAVSVYCYLSENLTLLAKLNIILFTLLCFAIKPLFQDTFMQWLFSYITVQNANASVVVVSFVISRYLPMPVYANSAVRLVLFIGIIYLLRNVVQPLYRQAVERWNIFFYVAVMIYINFAYYILASDNIEKTLTEQAPQLLLLIVLSVAAYGTVFHSLKTLSREYDLREENLKMQGRQELLSVSISAMEQRLRLQAAAAQQASIARHDHRHFSGTLLELLQQGQTEKAILLLEQQFTASKVPRRFCENTTVNAAVSYYANLCEQSAVTLHAKLDIPDEIGINNLELSLAVSNLLENALHACQKLPEGEKRIIQFSALFTGQLLLEMGNPYAGDVDLDESGYPTSKEEGHGIGTKSVIAFVEKQNGQLTYRTENGIFRVRLML